MRSLTPEQARHYINTFAKHILPGSDYVTFSGGRTIYFNSMTDEEALEVAHGLMDIEAKAAKKANLNA